MSTMHGAGWVALPALLEPDQVDSILADLDGLLALPAAERLPQDKPVSGTRHLEELDRRASSVAALIEDRRLVDLVDDCMPGAGAPVQVSYRSPQPGYGGQYLHADDLPRMTEAPTQVVTVIVALCDFTEANGATRLIPGSHRRPDLQRLAGQLADHPDAQTLTGPAGTAFVFDGHVLHSGTQNDSNEERPALQILWRP